MILYMNQSKVQARRSKSHVTSFNKNVLKQRKKMWFTYATKGL
jgi:hypothetical protein